MSTATAPISARSIWACWQTKAIAGVERLRVAPAAAHLEQAEHALVPADRHAHLRGGRLDAEDQHEHTAARSAAQRAAHDGPTR